MKLIRRILLVILVLICFIPATNSNYLDTETSTSNTFSAGCWSPPTVPTLLSPADSGATNLADIILDWTDSSFVCPSQTVEYQYQLNGIDSAWQPNSDTTLIAPAEDVYSWKVRARDSQGYMSNYSATWTFTVDRTPPTTYLDFNGYEINETVVNGGFEYGATGWTRAGDVVYTAADTYTSPHSGAYMARIGDGDAFTGNEIWENKLTQQLTPGAKNLSFYYNFFSFDSDPFDNPGMVVRLNDYNVFYLSAGDIDTFGFPNSSGWAQLSFDISQIDDPVLEIIFYSGNTEDEFNQSWVYIDNISTGEAVAIDSSPFTLSATDNLSGVSNTYYSLDGGITFNSGTSFDLSSITSETTVHYYSVDNTGNVEGINTRRLVKDAQPPDAIFDLSAFSTSKQTIELSWTVPNDLPNNTSPTVYDIRYALTPITNDTLFDAATQVPNPPVPRLVGDLQTFELAGLDSDTDYYFAIKSADAALNWSALSNTATDITLDIFADPFINLGDVVINELMWMGTSASTSDEFLELRNMTDMDIDLTDWVIQGAGLGHTDLIIPFGIIPAHGYFLITNYDSFDPSSKLNDFNVLPDWVTTSLTLYSSDAQYVLTDNLGFTIDIADNGLGEPAAGQHDIGSNIYYSMERDATPSDGTQASSWHTIFDDSITMQSYWDAGALEKGTPGGPNLSQSPLPSLTPLPTPSPTPLLKLSPALDLLFIEATPSAMPKEPESTPSAILIIEPSPEPTPSPPPEPSPVATDSAKINE
ncbi:OmpL47-type beta-barrel domain-containing protein [Patescibacteria group bacterium]